MTNARLEGREIERQARVAPEAMRLLAEAAARLALSARGWDRVLRLARTIADLAGSEGVRAPHVAEAIQYRSVSS